MDPNNSENKSACGCTHESLKDEGEVTKVEKAAPLSPEQVNEPDAGSSSSDTEADVDGPLDEESSDPDVDSSDSIYRSLASQITQVRLGEEGVVKHLSSPDLKGIVEYIKSGKCKNIVVMTGAGISVAAGIPDFRTPGTGLYYNLQKYELPVPEAIFELNFFRANPQPFFVLAKELYPGQFEGTDCHWFVRLLHEKGLLLRNYTQNIDTLEVEAGIPEDKLVFAHGSFATASCIACKASHTRQWVKDEIFADRVPACLTCKTGLVKPDIVFFGENLPDRFFDQSKIDLPKADLLLVMGTSLTVFPFAGLMSKVGINCPRVLINRDPVGAATPLMLLRGHLGFDFGGTENYRDVPLLGDCQDTCLQLISELGWEKDFKTLKATIRNESSNIPAATASPAASTSKNSKV